MRIRIFALGLIVTTASLWGQKKFSWQNYCFDHPGSVTCKGNDYAVKPEPKAPPPARSVYKNPFPPTPVPRTAGGGATPALLDIGGMDWRFADPFPDVMAGFNLEALSASPLARALLSQLGAKQGLTEADINKMFDGLSGIDQAALSLIARGGTERMVVMVTGRVTELPLPAPEAGMKAVTISGSSLLMGNANAVDEAAQRIAMKWPPADLTRMAEQLQAANEFWAIGPAAMIGPQAMSSGMKRFWLAVSIRDRLTTDVAFEFNGVPSASIIKNWQTQLGAATIEGNVIHVRMSMDADEVRQKFGEIAASPVGERLGDLLKAARTLPVRDTTVPKQNKPVIYGLDEGPRVVNH